MEAGGIRKEDFPCAGTDVGCDAFHVVATPRASRACHSVPCPSRPGLTYKKSRQPLPFSRQGEQEWRAF